MSLLSGGDNLKHFHEGTETDSAPILSTWHMFYQSIFPAGVKDSDCVTV